MNRDDKMLERLVESHPELSGRLVSSESYESSLTFSDMNDNFEHGNRFFNSSGEFRVLRIPDRLLFLGRLNKMFSGLYSLNQGLEVFSVKSYVEGVVGDTSKKVNYSLRIGKAGKEYSSEIQKIYDELYH